MGFNTQYGQFPFFSFLFLSFFSLPPSFPSLFPFLPFLPFPLPYFFPPFCFVSVFMSDKSCTTSSLPLELLCFYFSMYIGADLPPSVFYIMMGFLGVCCLLLVYIASFFFPRIYSINLIFHFLEQNGIVGPFVFGEPVLLQVYINTMMVFRWPQGENSASGDRWVWEQS